MSLGDKIAMSLGIAALAIAVYVFFYRVFAVRAGADGQKKRVSRFLHRYVKPRKEYVLDDVKLILGPLSGWANHILIGQFGVLLVYDVSVIGEYFGKPDDEKWSVLSKEGKRWLVENPLHEANKCEGRVRTLLKERANLTVPVEKAVVISCPVKGAVSHIRAENVMLLSRFKSYLRKDKFAEDRNIHPEEVYKILSEANS